MRAVEHAVLLVATILVVASSYSTAPAQKCLNYGPTVSLNGKLSAQIFPGRPNYESIKKGDESERAIILKLSSPICTNHGPDGFDAAETNVRVVQLVVMQSTQWKTVESRLGRRVRVTCTLFHGHTGHHRTAVLIMVSAIRPA